MHAGADLLQALDQQINVEVNSTLGRSANLTKMNPATHSDAQGSTDSCRWSHSGRAKLATRSPWDCDRGGLLNLGSDRPFQDSNPCNGQKRTFENQKAS